MALERDDENLCEVQENEVEALKAIFGRDCSDLREGDVWKKRRPPELLLRLLPENGTQGHIESHVSVCLHIVTDQAYPLKRPSLSLEEPKGLSEAKQHELLVRLRDLAASLEGGEMIYELAVEVGAFLAKHNSKGFCSMAEEMEVRRRQEEEKREEGVMLMEDIKRKELAKSVEERRREIAEEQAQLKKEEALALSRMRTSSEGLGEQRRKKTCSVSSENVPSVEVLLNISGQKVIVLQGALLGTNSLGQVRTFGGNFQMQDSFSGNACSILPHHEPAANIVNLEVGQMFKGVTGVHGARTCGDGQIASPSQHCALCWTWLETRRGRRSRCSSST